MYDRTAKWISTQRRLRIAIIAHLLALGTTVLIAAAPPATEPAAPTVKFESAAHKIRLSHPAEWKKHPKAPNVAKLAIMLQVPARAADDPPAVFLVNVESTGEANADPKKIVEAELQGLRDNFRETGAQNVTEADDTLAGLPAKRVSADVDSRHGKARTTVIFAANNSTVYVVNFICPPSQVENFKPQLDAVLKSFEIIP